MSERFPKEVETLLREAGWSGQKEKITVRLPSDFVLFPAAESVLREFGGLKIGKLRRGIDFLANDVNLEPSLGEGLHQNLVEFEKVIGEKLYPLGEYCDTQYFLLISTSGSVYSAYGDLYKTAPNFDEALISLLLGKKKFPKDRMSRLSLAE